MKRETEQTLRRYLHATAALVVTVLLVVWLRPINVPGSGRVPFACGSAASPHGGDLATWFCGAALDGQRIRAGALLIAAAMIVFCSEALLPRRADQGWLVGVLVVVPVAIPLLLLSIGSTVSTIGTVSGDGTPISCGTVLDPPEDQLTQAFCGELPEQRRAQVVGGAVVGVGLLLAGAFVTHRRPHDEHQAVEG